MRNSLCFVLMPFGKKPDGTGRLIDFDAIYKGVIAPAIADAGLEPIRTDEELAGGIIHKAMLERLVLCAYAVADLTTANANVFYELGIRHAIRPWRTVPMFADGVRLPFDVQYLRALPYTLDAAGLPLDAAAVRSKLAASLRAARDQAVDPTDDSPVYQLLEYMPRAQLPHQKTDVFRDQEKYSSEAKRQLGTAGKKDVAAIDAVLRDLRPLAELEVGVLLEAMLAYRALKAWPQMLDFIDRLPREIRETVTVQEQRGLALNRAGRGDEAEQVLLEVVARRGPSPETLGILGRVYKDRWEAAVKKGDADEARALLDKAIATYLRGFEADFRDSYPGINAVTLMELRRPRDPRQAELLPIVRYAVSRKMAVQPPDYWDHATVLELAVLAKDAAATTEALGKALAEVREAWWPETTARNLSLIRKARAQQGETMAAADDAERKLRQKAGLDAALS